MSTKDWHAVKDANAEILAVDVYEGDSFETSTKTGESWILNDREKAMEFDGCIKVGKRRFLQLERNK